MFPSTSSLLPAATLTRFAEQAFPFAAVASSKGVYLDGSTMSVILPLLKQYLEAKEAKKVALESALQPDLDKLRELEEKLRETKREIAQLNPHVKAKSERDTGIASKLSFLFNSLFCCSSITAGNRSYSFRLQ